MTLNRRVFKLLLQLDNDNDNLVLLAARKIVGDLKAHGSDLRVLANALEDEWERQAAGGAPRRDDPPPPDPPRGGRLTDEEYEELVEILEGLDGKSMSAKSRDFVADMTARHDRYGRRTMVSPKQWDWLRSLRDE
jgi:hypothetical protein